MCVTINGPDHLTDLKAVDDSSFLWESKCYSIFLHPGGTYHPFHLCSILYNTNPIISNNIYKENRLSGCVYPMINFVLDLSTNACHQKDSKLVYFAWTVEMWASERIEELVAVVVSELNKEFMRWKDNATFDRLSVSNAVCKMGSENYPDDGMECNYDRDKYDQAYTEIENHLKSETNLLNPFIDLHKFRRSYNFYVFDLPKQKDHIAGQPIRLEFKFNAAFGVADYIAYALVLTPKLKSINSDGQRHFDILW